MTDEFELRLRERLRSTRLPAAPGSLRDVIDSLPTIAVQRPATGHPLRLLGIAAALATVGLVAAVVGSRPSDSITPPPSAPPTGSGVAVLPTASREPSGERVFSVSELLAARDAGELGSRSVLVEGYWSESVPHSCPAPDGTPGVLEIYCHDNEFGIAERNEPVLDVTDAGFSIQASGPWITPFVEPIASRFMAPPIAPTDDVPLTPIIARGHFDDPRAAECRPQARELCRDRFVISQVVQFEPMILPPPTAGPNPTPFPSPPPPPPFGPSDCFVEPSQVRTAGWTTAAAIGIDSSYAGWIYAVVTEPMPLGIEGNDANGEPYEVWSQVACYRADYYLGTDVDAVFVKMIGASMYREYEDGRRVPEPLAVTGP